MISVAFTVIALASAASATNVPAGLTNAALDQTVCTRSGCNMEICSENVMGGMRNDDTATTCQFKPYYDCYKLSTVSCGRFNGQCAWGYKNNDFPKCMQDKGGPLSGAICLTPGTAPTDHIKTNPAPITEPVQNVLGGLQSQGGG